MKILFFLFYIVNVFASKAELCFNVISGIDAETDFSSVEIQLYQNRKNLSGDIIRSKIGDVANNKNGHTCIALKGNVVTELGSNFTGIEIEVLDKASLKSKNLVLEELKASSSVGNTIYIYEPSRPIVTEDAPSSEKDKIESRYWRVAFLHPNVGVSGGTEYEALKKYFINYGLAKSGGGSSGYGWGSNVWAGAPVRFPVVSASGDVTTVTTLTEYPNKNLPDGINIPELTSTNTKPLDECGWRYYSIDEKERNKPFRLLGETSRYGGACYTSSSCEPRTVVTNATTGALITSSSYIEKKEDYFTFAAESDNTIWIVPQNLEWDAIPVVHYSLSDVPNIVGCPFPGTKAVTKYDDFTALFDIVLNGSKTSASRDLFIKANQNFSKPFSKKVNKTYWDKNLVFNGGYESGLDGWLSNIEVARYLNNDNIFPYSGEKYLGVAYEEHFESDESDYFISHPIPIKKGKSYTFSFQYRATPGVNDPITQKAKVYGFETKEAWNTFKNEFTGSFATSTTLKQREIARGVNYIQSFDWSNYSISFSSTKYLYVVVALLAEDGDFTGNLYFDGVHVVEE